MQKDIGNYILYSDGRLFNKAKNSFNTKWKTERGYFRIKVNGRNWLLHRLLAIHFIPNPDNLPEVNHIDGDPSNHSLDNLEWVTPSQNCQHSYDIGKQNKKGSKNVKAILTEAKVLKIRTFLGRNRKCLASIYNVSINTIHDILSRRTWRHI